MFAIPRAALTVVPPNRFRMILEPWSFNEKPKLPITLQPAKANISLNSFLSNRK